MLGFPFNRGAVSNGQKRSLRLLGQKQIYIYMGYAGFPIYIDINYYVLVVHIVIPTTM